LVFGTLLAAAQRVAEKHQFTLVDMRFVKPIDEALIREMASSHALIVTLEEASIMGGAGSAVSEVMQAHGLLKPLLQLGLPDVFIDHGDPAVLLASVGLDSAGIEASIVARLQDLA
jgi:1-deoxy-D-xylulose-5-phosphate synthase